MQNRVKEIVITGGPCSGKTTGIKELARKLGALGFRVFTVPEVATSIIQGGVYDISKIAKTDFEKYLRIQEQILLYQGYLRHLFNSLAGIIGGQKIVILYDRAETDSRAYVPEGYFQALLQKNHLGWHDVRDSYHAVFHLVTAAEGAEEFYTTKNNEARQEKDLDEAREQDKKTLAAWTGHPHLRIIDNSTDFAGKIERLFRAACRALGHPEPLEIERKFLLVKKPNFSIKALQGSQKIFVEQKYLDGPRHPRLRIRKKGQDGSYTYYCTEKTSLSPRRRRETEDFITASVYLQLGEFQNPNTEIIRKYRYYFVYENQYFELDVFQEPKRVKGLCLLEIELMEENGRIKLPPFLNVEREVTEDPAYSTFEIARKK